MIFTKRNKFFEGHLLKVLSFITASFLWFYVVNSEPIQLKRSFKINIVSPVGIGVDQMSVSKVEVTLKGARAFLKEFRENDNEITLDLSKRKITTEKPLSYSISEHDFILPFGVDVVEFSPEAVQLGFDRIIKKKIPVKSAFQTSLSDELQLVDSTLAPSSVMVEGPRSVMKGFGITKTRGIDLAALSGNGEIDIELAEPPDFISYLEKPNFKFIYNIKPKSANLTLKRIEIKFITSHQRFKASKDMVSLDVLAPEGRVLTAGDIKVFAEIPDGKKGKFDVRLRAELPEGVHLLNINPPIVSVNVF